MFEKLCLKIYTVQPNFKVALFFIQRIKKYSGMLYYLCTYMNNMYRK